MPNNNVDERIVEMRIDHEKFEAGAKKAISILEKLDKSLDGLNDVGSDGLDKVADSLEIVNKRFSAMGIVGDQVIRNLTNKAMELVGQMTRLGKSLTIDQVGAGWSQYADKTAAVQTIMAATANEFENQAEQIEVVNAQLDRLITFADETSYSFLDMTSNVGKFTSNGMGLEESVTAMQGISTWAALSGANVQQASHAMYNLSQAIGLGAVTLLDWKSIENANMGTREFKQTALDTAVALGTLTKTADGFYKTQEGHIFNIDQFREQLSDKWFSSDVLMKTLDTYGAFSVVMTEAIDDTGLLARDILKALDEYKKTGKATEELLPWLEKLSAAEMELGEKAFRAAQETKTFREMIDATQDAARTKWMSIFELMFGGYLEAKQFWSNAAEEMYTIFVDPLNNLIDIFKVAFGEGDDGATGQITTLEDALKSAGRTLEDFEVAFFDVDSITLGNLIREYGTLEEAIKKGAVGADLFKKVLTQMSKTTGHGSVGKAIKSVDEQIAEMREVATGVLRGDYGAGEERKRILTELGYDYDMIQWIAETMVGEPQTDTKTLLGRYKPEWLQQIEETASAAGHTDAEIEAMNYMLQNASDLLAEIEAGAEDAGEELRDMVHSMSGRALLTGGIQNLLHFFADLTTVITNASNALFGGPDAISNAIHRVLEDFYIFTASIQLGEDRVQELSNGFSTLSGILHYIGAAFMGVVRFGGKIVKFIFDTVKGIIEIIRQSGAVRAFGQALLTIFGALTVPLMLIGELIGNLIKRFRSTVGKRWGSALMDIFTALANKITIAATHIKEFFESSEVAEWITDKFAKLEVIISKVSKRVQFFFGALKLGYKKNGIKGIFTSLAAQFNWFLQQHPKLAAAFEKISGWIGRITAATSKGYGSVRDWFANFSLDKIKISMPTFQQVVEFFLRIFRNAILWISETIKNLNLNSITESLKTAFNKIDVFGALKEFGDSIRSFFSDTLGIHIFDQTFFDNMWEFLDGVQTLLITFGSGALIVGFSTLMLNMAGMFKSIGNYLDVMSAGIKPSKLKNFGWMLLMIAGSILVIATAIKMISDIVAEEGGLWRLLAGVGTIVVVLAALVGTCILLGKFGGDFKIYAVRILLIAAAIGIMAKALQIVSSLSFDEYKVGLAGLFSCALILLAFMSFTTLTGASPAKGMIQLVFLAIAVRSFAIALSALGKMSWADMIKATIALGIIMSNILMFTWSSGSFSAKDLGQLLKVAIGIVLIAHAFQSLGHMKFKQILVAWFALSIIIGQIGKLTRQTETIKEKGLNGLIGAAIAVVLFANAFKSLGHMKFKNILVAWFALARIIGQVTRLTKKTGSIQEKGLSGLIGVSIAIVAIAYTFRLLSYMPLKDALKAYVILWLLVRQVIKITNKAGKLNGGKEAFLNLLGIVGVIGALVAALVILTRIEDYKKLYAATAVLISTLFAISGMLFVLTKFDKKVNKNALGSLILVMLSLWGISEILAKHANGNWKQLGETALVLIGTLIGIVASVILLNRAVKDLGWKSLTAIPAILVVLGALYGIGYILSQFAGQNWKELGGIAIVLIGTLIGIAGSIYLLNKASKSLGLKSLLAVIAIGVVLAALYGVAYVLSQFAGQDWKQLGGIAIVLVGTLLGIVGVLMLLGAGGTLAITGAGVLVAIAAILMVGLLAVIALGALTAAFASSIKFGKLLSDFMTSLDPFLQKMKALQWSDVEKIGIFAAIMGGLALAEIFAAVAAIIAWLSDLLTYRMAYNLSIIIDELMPFIYDIRELKWTDVEQVSIFAAIMGGLALASVFELVAGIIGLVANLLAGNLGSNLSSLALTLSPFLTACRFYTDDDVERVNRFTAIMQAIAATTIWEAVSNLLSKLNTALGGAAFLESLADVALNLNPLILQLRLVKYDEADVKNIQNFAAIMKAIALSEVWTTISSILGAVQEKWGSMDFMSNLADLATNVKGFVESLRTGTQLTEEDAENVQAFADIMKAIAISEVWTTISDVLDAFQNVIGGSSNFMTNLGDLATNVKPFIEKLGDIPDGAQKKAEGFVQIMRAIADVEVWGFVAQIFDSINPLFGVKLSGFMIAMQPFFTKLTNLPDTDTTTQKIDDLSEFLRHIAIMELWGNITSWLSDITKNEDSWSSFGTSMEKFGEDVLPFFTTFGEMDERTINNAQTIIEAMDTVAKGSTISEFVRNITKSIGDIRSWAGESKNSVDAVQELSNLLTVLGGLAQALADLQAASNKTSIVDSLESMVSSALSESSNSYSVQTDANTAGENIVKGIALGIDASLWIIRNSMINLAFSALSFFTNSKYVDSHSPSRAYEVVGGYMAEGLAKGVTENVGVAEDSMTVLGSAVLAAIQQAMLNVATVADDNYEFHPTITPVVDLSNVNAASGAVSGAFNGNYGISAQMSASVNRRMSDIERLAANVNGVGGQTVNGDNITVNVYPSPGQDPEAIADAVINRINSRSIRRGVAFG